ncbi:uncharacterized protein BDR25DRAFT_306401 [Lindgomyces ingoldianus]|uniref:Uncharacterized protein n=1 Tax=Lindgomyces ingoldianus TaxID=673940 RepID=A0ACB6QID6_9PLEO|nr:uncharacterized protein BDR25DRAFT_306401 [Lindgomyces ingoldianus]KAF2465905.1 hypothetical protein BDR25DRAFT_306401 [Lindgomyces ingoldianus]
MASTKTATSTPALSFPRPIFAAISPHPFLQAHLSAPGANKGFRANARSAQEFRTPGIKTGTLTHCHGSAVVRLGNTSVVCGVRGEILRVEDVQDLPAVAATDGVVGGIDGVGAQEDEEEDEEEDEGELEGLRLLVPNLELNTGSAPSNIPGSAPSAAAQTLITRIRSLLLSTRLIRAKDLRIAFTPLPLNTNDPDNPPDTESQPVPEVKAYWTLYLDILFISLDGSAFDAAWLAILAALKDTVLPKASWDEDVEMVLCSDKFSDAERLRLRGLPVASTFAVFEGRGDDLKDVDMDEDGDKGPDWVLSDPDAFEEGVCREGVCIVLDCSDRRKKARGQIRRIEKSGGGVVDRDVMKDLVTRSFERWAVCERVLRGVGEATV